MGKWLLLAKGMGTRISEWFLIPGTVAEAPGSQNRHLGLATGVAYSWQHAAHASHPTAKWGHPPAQLLEEGTSTKETLKQHVPTSFSWKCKVLSDAPQCCTG